MTEAPDRLRIDKWLWHARFSKTRGLAATVVERGSVRVNGQRVVKPGRAIGPGDVLTLAIAGQVRVVRVLGCGTRRGPASEAQELYLSLDAGGGAEETGQIAAGSEIPPGSA